MQRNKFANEIYKVYKKMIIRSLSLMSILALNLISSYWWNKLVSKKEDPAFTTFCLKQLFQKRRELNLEIYLGICIMYWEYVKNVFSFHRLQEDILKR